MKKFKKGVLAIGVLAAAAVIAAGCGKKDAKTTNETKKEKAIPTKLNSVEKQEITRITTTFSELDRVLGGGFVKGSLTLLGGEPGIRKININITNLR